MSVDSDLGNLLLKIHKGATASFNAKKTAQVLSLFPGWSMVPATFIKPSDEARSLTVEVTVPMEAVHYKGSLVRAAGERRIGLLAYSRHDPAQPRSTRLVVHSYNHAEAIALHAEVAKLVVTALPEPKKAKTEDKFVMNLSEPVATTDEDRTTWVWSFDLFRMCKGYVITSPDQQQFEVCGPVQILGYHGTQDFGHFFQWALANTTLETEVNAKLGLARHVPAAERPRVPVGGQTIGTCAICSRSQVVRNGVMVEHGYQRPGYGWIVGSCFGVRYQPYELSADACVAYVPVLEDHKAGLARRLDDLRTGKVTQFVEKKHNYRTNRDEQIVTKEGDKDFPAMLKSAIADTETQIKLVNGSIKETQRRITDWTLGTLRHNDG